MPVRPGDRSPRPGVRLRTRPGRILLAVLLGTLSCGHAVDGGRGEAERFFSQDYGEARKKFLYAARAAGARVESYPHPLAGPGGEPLAVDVALLGPGEAESVVAVISGTHGVEGFAGSALQTGLLEERVVSPLPPGEALLLIHALNPHGFAHLRRFTEENVDLNRNFVDHSLPSQANPGYAALHQALAPASRSLTADLHAFFTLARYRLRHGKRALQDAVTLGQYDHPEGLFYGGRAEAWSNVTLRKITERHLATAKRVVVIEIHTGLGDFGNAEIILNERRDSAVARRARRWWGAAVRSTADGESVSADVVGTLKRALPAMLPRADVTAVGLEFGTRPAYRVLWALRAENWLHHRGGRDHPDAGGIREGLRQAFNPDSAVWRARVWRQGREIVGEALRRLPEESSRRR